MNEKYNFFGIVTNYWDQNPILVTQNTKYKEANFEFFGTTL